MGNARASIFNGSSGLVSVPKSLAHMVTRHGWRFMRDRGCYGRVLTFDMSGSQKPAKLAGGCPIDGGVRRHDSQKMAAVALPEQRSATRRPPEPRTPNRARAPPNGERPLTMLLVATPQQRQRHAPVCRSLATTRGWHSTVGRSWCLTFDMRRSPKRAKRVLGRRLNGRVRPHGGAQSERSMKRQLFWNWTGTSAPSYGERSTKPALS